MAKPSLSFSLLTLFTPADRADSIHGDLTEEARTRGRIWFWVHILGTSVALCWTGFPRSPVRLIGLTVAGMAAWFVTNVVVLILKEAAESGLAAAGVVVSARATPVMFVATVLAGIVLVKVAPRWGIFAYVAAATVSVPFLAYVVLNASSPDEAGDLAFEMAVALPVVALMLAASYHWRQSGPEERSYRSN